MIAVGIGFHNLGEGLAIGAAYSIGEIALGTFLVVGFIIQNITEGLGIIAPVLRDNRPLGGLPWWDWSAAPLPSLVRGSAANCLSYSWPFYSWQLERAPSSKWSMKLPSSYERDTAKEPCGMTVFSGVLTGMLMLWVTGLLIK